MSSTKQFKTLRAISHCGGRVEAKTIISLTDEEAERYGDDVQLVQVEAAADATEAQPADKTAGEGKAKDSKKDKK